MNWIAKVLTRIETYALGLTVLVLALFACVQVFTRYVLNYSFTSYEEIGRFTCIFITFLGASLGIKRGTHFAMTAVTDRLPQRAAGFVAALVWLMAAVFCFAVTYFGSVHCYKQYQYETITPALRIPMYIPFLPIPAFFAVMGVRCLIKVYHELQRMVSGRPVKTNRSGPGGEA